MDTEEKKDPEEWRWKKFRSLVISGAGVNGISSLGAIHYCETQDMLDIDEYIGTSSGSMISYLLAIGYTAMEIMCYLCVNNSLSKLEPINITNILSGMGIYDFQTIQIELEKMTIDKIGKVLTLEELYKLTQKTLTCVTYNDTKTCVEYINWKSHPNLPCIQAVRMSSNIPFIFGDYRYMGEYYIDGGFIDNFPFERRDKELYTLGVNTLLKVGNVCGQDLNPYQRINNLLTMMFLGSQEPYIDGENARVVDIPIDGVSISNIVGNLRTPIILDLFSHGFRNCEKIFPMKKNEK